MQLAKTNREVQTSGVLASKEQGIIMDATMFSMLSDGLYSDKIGSMVRETYSNVVDSHKQAGKGDAPGWIKLPTPIDPTFVVRDEGVGLDHEGVVNIAGDYGSSTKRADNDSIGGFGLGFKSPYAVSDQWSIKAIKEGTVRLYSCYKNEDGKPCTTLLSEGLTGKPDGVEVSVPIKPGDISRVAEAVRKQLQYFPQRPIVSGGEIEWPEPDYLQIEGVGSLRSVQSWRNEGNWYAIVGGVGVPINITKTFREQNNTAVYNAFSRTSGTLLFDVGELIPDPSRESLQYTERAIQAITAKAEQLSKGVAKEASKVLESEPNYLEAVLATSKLMKAGISQFLSSPGGVRPTFKYKGQDITTQVSAKLPEQGTVSYLYEHDLSKKGIAVRNANHTEFHIDRSRLPRTYIAIDDVQSKTPKTGARLKKYFEENQVPVAPNMVLVLRGCELDDLNEPWVAHFPKERIIRLSEVELPKPVTRSATASGGKRVPSSFSPRMVTQAQRETLESVYIHPTDFTTKTSSVPDLPDDGGYYVITNRGEVGNQAISLLQASCILPGDVYFIPATYRNLVENDKNWKNFYEEAKKEAAKNQSQYIARIKKAKLFEYVTDCTQMQGMFSLVNHMSKYDIKTKPRSTRPVWKLYGIYQKALISKADRRSAKALERYMSWSSSCDFDDQKRETKKQIDQLCSELKTNNPLLVYAFSSTWKEPTKETIEEAITKLF